MVSGLISESENDEKLFLYFLAGTKWGSFTANQNKPE